MLKNYFKIAWRNITRHRFYSIVNIVGLFAGIGFALLMGAYVWGEIQVNKKLKNIRQQYFLKSEWKDPNTGPDITTLGPLSRRLKEEYPNLVANYYRWDGITSIVTKGDKHFREGIQLGDSSLLSMYGFTLQQGDAKTALNNPYSVILTAEMAIKYFGKTDVVGQTLGIQSFSGGNHEFAVTGVLYNTGKNSVTEINDVNHNGFFIPINTISYFGRTSFEDWTNIYLPSYIELKEGVTPVDLQKPIQHLIQQHTDVFVQNNLHINLVALKDYYLQKDNGLVKRMLYTLSLAGLFILLMAMVNFINIAVSNSGTRMREIGVRKVLGGLRKQLIVQFLTESLTLVLIATLLAIVTYPLLRPFFSHVVGSEIPALSSFPAYFLLVPVIIVFAVGLGAGIYPAFILSSLKSVDSLKGKLKTAKGNILLRKSLVGFQFCIAIIVLIASVIVAQQVSLFFSKNLGYNKEYIVSSQVPRDWTKAGVQKMETIRNEFAAIPQVSNVSLSYEIPNGMNGSQPPVYKAGADSSVAIPMQALITDEHYLDTYQVPLRAGNFFNNIDSGKVVLNETAAYVLGWKNVKEAEGQLIRIPGDPTLFTVKGISADFHFGSMQQKITPCIFFNVSFAPSYRYLSFKLRPGNISAGIDAIQKKWAVLLPGSSFEYSFMDDTLKKLYSSEIQLKKAAYGSAVLMLVIVLLGVTGLISLSIHKRVKEIGIRKVLGASLPNIVLLFIREFIMVIVIAAGIACPLARLLMQKWLSEYAYRIDITAMPFILSILLVVLVTAVLIIIQTIKTAMANPVKSLRTE